MQLNQRYLVVVSALFAVTCAHERAREPSEGMRMEHARDYADDEAEGDLSRPDGELASSAPGGAPAVLADRSIAMDSATSAPVAERGTKKASKEESYAPASPAPMAAPAPAAPASAHAPKMVRTTSGRVAPAKAGAPEGGRTVSAPARREVDDTLSSFGKPEERPAARPRVAPVAPALKAGRHDDNKEYNRFLAFLDQYHHLAVYATDISERLQVRALDRSGGSLPNCPVTWKSAAGRVLAKTTTYADGSTQFFPAAQSQPDDRDYAVEVRCGGATRNGQLARGGVRTTEIRFDVARKVPTPMPVDVAIVLDTTGSMQGQIDRLKQTLKAIHYQLTALSTRPDIRFAMVAYRDRGDEYVTRVTPFSGDIEAYQHMLEHLVADGGGDMPEDLQTALEVAMHQLKWRPEALRIGFVITDAPPHTNYGQAYNYLSAMQEALGRGIKWVTVGAGGLPIDGEVIYRQIAQYTMGEYVFLTQGGGDDSEGGGGEASHHVGANYRTENLDQAIVRIVRRELSYLTAEPKDFDTTIVASAGAAASRDQVLVPAVAELLRQLADYSALKLDKKTLVAVAPVTTADKKHKSLAEYLTDQLSLSASRNDSFKLVERELGAVTQEMKLQLSNLFDEGKTVPIGKLVGAEVLIVGKLVVKDGDAELFAKLIRVATGEVLSVANVRVTGGAGI
jgi:Mg-chelatase subunit ChlD